MNIPPTPPDPASDSISYKILSELYRALLSDMQGLRAQLTEKDRELEETRVMKDDLLKDLALAQATETLRDDETAKDRRIAELDSILAEIDLQAVAKELAVRLGYNIAPAILPGIRALKARIAELEAALGKVVTEFERGDWEDAQETARRVLRAAEHREGGEA